MKASCGETIPCWSNAQIRVVHELHPLPFSAHDHVLQFLRRAFANDGGHGGARDQDFVDRDAAGSVRSLEQELREDAAQRIGQHRAGLRLLVRGKDVDHAVDGFARVVRVQRSEDEQAGLGRGERERDGLEVAHFADQHDVAIFAQGGLQADGKESESARALRAG